MAKTYVQPGNVLDWTNGTGAAVSSGDVVVVGQQIGVALVDIADGETGSLAMSGVFTCPKVAAAAIGQGEEIIWDASAAAFDDSAAVPATGDVSRCCVAAKAAGNGATTVDVKLNVGVGTVA